ncbi:MAG: DUF4070 domain-containing protein, partial [Spirochaetales bacterium]
IPGTFWSYNHAIKFQGKKSLMPPLGLMTIAAMLPSDFESRILDMNVEKLKDRDIAESDIVFISAMIVQKDSFEGVVAMCNRLGVPVAAGGPYVTSLYEKIAGVDHFILDEGEITLHQFIEDYRNGTPKPVYRTEDKPDVALTPVPRFDLVDMKDYTSMPLQYSRVCPFSCEFCDIINLFGRKMRTKGVEQFLGELQAVYDIGYRGNIFVVDDNFIGNKMKVKELLRAIVPWLESHNFPFDFTTEASVNLSQDEELMDLMAKARFVLVFLGIETPVAASLQSAGKSQNLKEDLVTSIHRIQEKGLDVCAGFIVGFDTDPENIFEIQAEFIKQLAIPTAMVGVMLALPNTQLHDRLKAEGRLLADSDGNNQTLDVNFVPVMPRDVLLNGYKRLLKEIYTPKNYFQRCREVIMRYPESRWVIAGGPRKKVNWEDVKSVLRSLFIQTFSSYGVQYLKFLWWTFRFNKLFLRDTIYNAVRGHHYFKMTRIIQRTPITAETEKSRNLRARLEGALAATIKTIEETTALPKFKKVFQED